MLRAANGTSLQLSYVHSVYRQPAVEEFRLDERGLELVRLRSVSVPVLEYYARPEPIRPTGTEHVIELQPELHRELTILVSAMGRRTVAYAGCTLPLYELAGEGDRVRLAVAPVSRLTLLWRSR